MYGILDTPLYYKEIYNSSSVNVTASNSSIAKVYCQKIGHIATLELEITVTITAGTGTIDTTKNIANAINLLTITDKDGKSIMLLTGNQLARAKYITSLIEQRDYATLRRGRYTALTALANVGTAQIERQDIPLNIKTDDQPLGIEVALNSLSSLLSSVGTATATFQLRIVAKAYKNPTVPYKTDRIYAFTTVSIPTGIQYRLTDNLPKRVLIQAIGIENGNDADSELQYVTLMDSGIGIDRIKDVDIVEFEKEATTNGHITGFYPLLVSPFQVTDTLNFNIEVGTARAYTIFLLHHGARE